MLRRTGLFRNTSKEATSKFAESYASTQSAVKGGSARSMTSLAISLPRSKPGALLELLKPFQESHINVSNVSNRTLPIESTAPHLTMFLDVDAHVKEAAMEKVLNHLRSTCPSVTVVGSWTIPWYPTKMVDLDELDQRTLSAGSELQDDPSNPHPGFHDEEYKARRKMIAENAYKFRTGAQIGTIEYTDREKATWTTVFDKLTAMFPTHACNQFNYTFPLFVESGVFSRERPPQLHEVSEFLQSFTGYTIRPVAGLLPTRDFLNAMAFRVFFSTQYLRHHSSPLYTPEPDMIHEILGHVPLFADPDFANFSQTIGFASLGASDEEIERLSRVYWYSIEFGLCKQGGGVRAYGAGILSSPGELEYCLTNKPKLLDWDPFTAATLDFPITTYQPTYFVADDFRDAQKKLKKFIDSQDRPFELQYNPFNQSIQTIPRHAADMMRDDRISKI